MGQAYECLDIAQNGWLSRAFELVRAKKPFAISVEAKLLFDVIAKVRERAAASPVSGIIIDIGSHAPVPMKNVAPKVIPWMEAVAAIGGGPLGAACAVAVAASYATLHGYEAGVAWKLHRLIDPNDDEAQITLDPPVA